MKDRSEDKQVFHIGIWITLGMAALIGAMQLMGFDLVDSPCVFQHMTGFYCPGCGGRRAVAAMLHGRIFQSILYHPLVLYGTVLYLWFMGSHTLEFLTRGRIRGVSFKNWFLYGAIVIIVLNWILKNALLLAGIDLLA